MNVSKSGRILLTGLLAMLWAIGPQAKAQTYGGVSGTVVDTTKAVIPGVKLTAVNVNTGATTISIANSQGFYTFPSLPAGTYNISAQSSGFTTQNQQNVIVNVASPVTLGFTLTSGSVSQTVTVASQALAIDTTSPALGSTMDTRQIENLPINGRDYARFSLLVPGAVARSNYISDLSFDGLQTVHNQFSIDGIDASRADQPYMANGYERGARLLTGSLETIAEFKVQTSGYQAQYGRAAGSEINIVTKSGGNAFHGTLLARSGMQYDRTYPRIIAASPCGPSPYICVGRPFPASEPMRDGGSSRRCDAGPA